MNDTKRMGLSVKAAQADVVIVQGRVVKNRFAPCDASMLIKDGSVDLEAGLDTLIPMIPEGPSLGLKA